MRLYDIHQMRIRTRAVRFLYLGGPVNTHAHVHERTSRDPAPGSRVSDRNRSSPCHVRDSISLLGLAKSSLTKFSSPSVAAGSHMPLGYHHVRARISHRKMAGCQAHTPFGSVLSRSGPSSVHI